jgi:hypothetical protein
MQMKILTFVGQRSSSFLLLGLVIAASLPWLSSATRPALPYLVALILGIAIAQINVFSRSSSLFNFRKLVVVFGIILVNTIGFTFLLLMIWQAVGLPEHAIILLIIFSAAPPLSSAVSLSLIIGFNAQITLQVTILSMLLTPIIGPICFALAGIDLDMSLIELSVRSAAMIGGGFLIGFVIQKVIGRKRIDLHKDAFSGAAVIVLIIFLIPLFDGVLEQVIKAPLVTVLVLILALVLNFGGNLIARQISRYISSETTANAIGFMFGNRNISIYLAILPFDPLISLFIAAAQIPIYATPAVFKRSNTFIKKG